VTGGQGVGVICAEDPLLVGEDLTPHLLGLAVPALRRGEPGKPVASS
jgi:hypothetical protein